MDEKKQFFCEADSGISEASAGGWVGAPVAEVIRKAGISEQMVYRWKAKYADLEVDEVRKMAQLQEEIMRLKQLVAELTLDKTMLQDVLSKQGEALVAWTDGGASGWQLPGKRAACLPRASLGKSDLPT